MKEINPSRPLGVFNKIAILGDFPHEDEAHYGKAFTTPGASVFKNLCASAGIDIHNTYWGYLSRVPVLFPQEPDRTVYRSDLRRELMELEANVVVLVGKEVLKAAGQTLSLEDLRGTSFRCNDTTSPFFGFKCIATHHPRDLIPQHDLVPIVRLDLEKVKKHATTPDLMHPVLRCDTNLNVGTIISKLDEITATPGGITIAMDIEGGVDNVTCLSIATSASYAFAIPLSTMSLEDETRVVLALNRCMRSYNVKKILQNSLYDNFALAWRYKMPILNVWWDTMLSGWEIYPELPKALGHQASIWTDFPAHKHERKISDWTTHLEYCCKDSMVTFEIAMRHQDYFNANPLALSHFRFNMSLLPTLLYMELRGMAYNTDLAKTYNERFALKQASLQAAIDATARRPINVNSPKQLNDLLYLPSPKGFGFKKQHPKLGNRKDVTRTTSNVDAILELQKLYDNFPLLDQILAWRKLEKLQQTTSVKTDVDQRVRCAYNLVGTDTGRLSCYESPTGAGTNLQTITKKLRCLYLSDPEYYYFQCDLAGADGWTVAARCAQLGDSTMLDDYLYGLKPAKIIALLYLHGAVVNSWTREEIKSAGKDIGNGDTEWLYFAGKRAQHGTNYLLGPNTMSSQILKDSYKYLNKTIIVKPKECERLQQLYRLRYPGVEAWQSFVRVHLYNHGTLPSASGHVRRFFGRRNDNSVIQSAVSHEPQANTTYVTNLATFNLWTDRENRRSDNSLIIQPLHSVHDALNGQFPIDLTSWSIDKIRQYFQFEVNIGSTIIRIPYEGAYGLSWGDCDANSGTPVGFF